jgi:hypothetical protein
MRADEKVIALNGIHLVVLVCMMLAVLSGWFMGSVYNYAKEEIPKAQSDGAINSAAVDSSARIGPYAPQNCLWLDK